MTHDLAAALVLGVLLGLTALTAYRYGLHHGALAERRRAASTRRSLSLARIQQRRHASWEERP